MSCYFIFFLVSLVQLVNCNLWPRGVVHYTINSKDYDIHSQEIITSTLSRIQREICVKFFHTPFNHTSSEMKMLYISNPDKRKNCPPEHYQFNGTVVDMIVGYKCLNPEDITRITIDMLRASIQQRVSIVNSYDLMKKFDEQEKNSSSLLAPAARNFINAHYHAECGALIKPAPINVLRSDGSISLTKENEDFYRDKLWPLGIVLYGVEEHLRNTQTHMKLSYAMTTVELSSCVVFQELTADDVLVPRSVLWFTEEGEDAPAFGFVEGNQTISLSSMVEGAPGHSSHTLNLLLRALGVPMMSNRHDRNNYVTVHWNRVKKGKEHFLERLPMTAWIHDIRILYDFESVTHAPANFMCDECKHGETTVEPAQDHLWQKTMTMGHRSDLSEGDKDLLSMLYSNNCKDRVTTNDDENKSV